MRDRSPRGKYGPPSGRMALITSGCGARFVRPDADGQDLRSQGLPGVLQHPSTIM